MAIPYLPHLPLALALLISVATHVTPLVRVPTDNYELLLIAPGTAFHSRDNLRLATQQLIHTLYTHHHLPAVSLLAQLTRLRFGSHFNLDFL